MLKSNDIDIFLLREDLLNIFNELISQIDNVKEIYNLNLNIINKLQNNNCEWPNKFLKELEDERKRKKEIEREKKRD